MKVVLKIKLSIYPHRIGHLYTCNKGTLNEWYQFMSYVLMEHKLYFILFKKIVIYNLKEISNIDVIK